MFKKLFGGKKGNQPEIKEVISVHENIAKSLASLGPENWSLIKIGIKIFNGGRSFTFRCFLGEDMKVHFMDIPRELIRPIEDLFVRLHELSALREETWVGCCFQVNNSGKYSCKFFYEEMEVNEIADAEPCT